MTKKNRPNILLVTADQWRGDCVGYAGHPVVKTPAMDALAAEGTTFLAHYSAAAPCSPARAALLTGLQQMNNRVVTNGTPLAHDIDNIAYMARRAGYEPTLFGYTDISADPRVHDADDPVLKTYEGHMPGFAIEQALVEQQAPWKRWLRSLGYDEDVVADPHALAPEPGQKIPTGATRFKAEHSQTAYLTGRLLEWVEEQKIGYPERPWFAHLSLICPHPPFAAPAPYNDMYAGIEGPAFRGHDDALARHPVVQMMIDRHKISDFVPDIDGGIPDLSEEDLKRIRQVYYGLISEVDAQLGRMVAALKAMGQWDNTLVIITSDHAEMMGDHGMLGKGGFFPQSQHIPLVVVGPGVAAGQRIDAHSSATDICATLLDHWDIAADNSLDGNSLLPFLKGETPDCWRDAVIWEFDFRHSMPEELKAYVPGGDRGCHLMVRLSKRYIYVQSPSVPALLFDREQDPDCQRNVIDDPAYAPVRLALAENLLQQRMTMNEQTLTQILLKDEGPVHIPEHRGTALRTSLPL